MRKESPRLSFKGYRFGEALYRNKDSVKGLVAILGGVNVALGFDPKALGLSLSVAVVGLGIKLLSDAVDFYFSSVPLE